MYPVTKTTTFQLFLTIIIKNLSQTDSYKQCSQNRGKSVYKKNGLFIYLLIEIKNNPCEVTFSNGDLAIVTTPQKKK